MAVGLSFVWAEGEHGLLPAAAGEFANSVGAEAGAGRERSRAGVFTCVCVHDLPWGGALQPDWRFGVESPGDAVERRVAVWAGGGKAGVVYRRPQARVSGAVEPAAEQAARGSAGALDEGMELCADR